VVTIDEVFDNPNRLDFRLTTYEGNLFSIVYFHLNLQASLKVCLDV
jgi:hypothetical protein